MATYALQHEWLHQTHSAYLDSWHVRLLRRVLKVKTTYIDRTRPNSWVYKTAKETPISQKVRQKQCKYYAHITRHPEDIIYKVCFAPGKQLRQLNPDRQRADRAGTLSNRRPGQPKEHWTPHIEQHLHTLLRDAASPVPNRMALHEYCQDRIQVGKLL